MRSAERKMATAASRIRPGTASQGSGGAWGKGPADGVNALEVCTGAADLE